VPAIIEPAIANRIEVPVGRPIAASTGLRQLMLPERIGLLNDFARSR
jgi:hypothetical protein